MKNIYLFVLLLFTSAALIAQCNYTMELGDSGANDGWTDGANMAVTVDGVTTDYAVPVGQNAFTQVFTFNTGQVVQFDYTRPTSFQGEISFKLTGPEGIVIFESVFSPPGGVYFDDTITCPTCPAVTAVSVSNVLPRTAVVDWTDGGTETEWEIEYGVAPYMANGTVSETVTAGDPRPYTIGQTTPLQPDTDYQLYVRSKCGPGDIGSSRGPIDFKTAESCATPSNLSLTTSDARSATFQWNSNGNPNTQVNVNYGVAPYNQGDPGGSNDSSNLGGPVAYIDGLTPDTAYQFYIQIDCGPDGLSGWAGPLNLTTAISCPALVNLEASFVGFDNIDLSWSSGGAETAWEVEYAPAGTITAPGTSQGTLVPANTNVDFNIDNLNPDTLYEFYVRGICDASTNDYSSWQLVSATTQCLPTAVTTANPYFVDFETFTATTTFTVENCWTTISDSAYDWNVSDTGTTPSGGTGPSFAHSGTTMMYIETLGANGDSATLLSPIMNVDGLTNPAVSFYLHLFGQNMGSLSVDVYDGTQWQIGLFTSAGQRQPDTDSPYSQGFIDLTGYTGDIQVRFVSTKIGNTSGDLALDDFMVGEAPNCFPTVFLQRDSATDTTVDLSWTTQGAETAWSVIYGPIGFDPTAAGTTIPAPTNPFTVTGLTSSTGYDFYVAADCGANGTSALDGPVSIFTNFNAPVGVTCPNGDNVIPFLTEFDSSAGWTGNVGDATATNTWNFGRSGTTASTSTGPSGAFSGQNYMYFETSGNATTPVEAVSPLIDLTQFTDGAELSFYYHAYGADVNNLDISVGTSPTGPWTQVFSAVGQYQFAETDPWLPAGVNLDAYVGQAIYLQLSATELGNASGFAGDIAVDLMQIETCGVYCSDINGLMVDAVTDSSVDFTLSDGNPNPANNYEYVIQPINTGVPTAAGTPTTTQMNTEANLTSNTQYELYVRTICTPGAGNSPTAWFGPVNFTTNCVTFTAPYANGAEAITSTFTDCFRFNPTTGFAWELNTGGATQTGNTGPNSAHEGSQYIFAESSLGATSDIATLETPIVDISTLTNPAVSFYSHMYGANTGTLHVDIRDDNGWTDDVLTLVGEQQSSGDEFWALNEIDLATLTIVGTEIQVRFRAEKGTGILGDIALDALNIGEKITCFPVTSLEVDQTTITANTLDVTWTGTAATYDLEWGPLGYTQGSAPANGGVQTGVTGSTFQITNLNPATVYDIYITSVCGANDRSFVIGPVSEITSCGILIAPFTQDFELFSVNLDFNNAPENCWTSDSANAFDWNVSGTNTTSAGTGPNQANSGSQFFYVEASSGLTGNRANLNLPGTDISGLTAPGLSFYYHMFGADTGSLIVEVDDRSGAGYVAVETIVGQQQSVQSDLWLIKYVDLGAFAGNTDLAIRFVGVRGAGFTSDISIDDVFVGELPNCIPVNNVAVDSVTDVTATISWTAASNATDYEIEVGAPGFAPGTGAELQTVNSTTSPVTISGLTEQTDYEFYIKTICGTDESLHLGPYQFTTICSSVIAPYTTDLENFTAALIFLDENCWTGESSNTFRWSLDTAGGTGSLNTGPSGANSGTNFFYTEASSGVAGDQAFLTSPLFDTSALTTPGLEFYTHMYGADIGTLVVEVNDFTGTGWTEVFRKTGQQQTAESDPYSYELVSLAAYVGQTIQIRFVGTSAGTFEGDMAIDDISVIESPGCFPPNSMSASTIGQTTVDIDFVDSNLPPATSWDVEVGLVGFTPGTGTEISGQTNVTSLPVTMTGLSVSTDYEVYVRANCSATDQSVFVGPIPFRTLCGTFTSPFSEDVEQFTNSLNFTNENCWSATNTGPFDWNVDKAGSTPTLNTGPLGGNSGVSYFYVEADGGANGDIAELKTPVIDLSGVTNASLEFYFHMYGANIGTLNVLVDDLTGAAPVQVFTLTGQQQTSADQPWDFSLVDLSAYNGQTVSVIFQAVKAGAGTGDISLDDISIIETPTCARPSLLTIKHYY